MREIRISERVSLPGDDLQFAFDRSSGPGGQNVNKVNTRVTLRFNVYESRGLSDEQKHRLLTALGGRVDADGTLRIVCDVHRTQAMNRRESIERFVELLRGGLRPPKMRRATRATAGSRQRRLASKRQRSQVKTARRWRGAEE